MYKESIELDYTPKLDEPLFIAGFDGWGNALDISLGMVDYLIRKLGAKPFGKINPDRFYRFDDKRPQVDIEGGLLKSIDPPGGLFYTASGKFIGRDIIILKAAEPNLRWFHFIDTILTLCQETGVKTIISLGSMYDNVLHTDTIVSALASSKELLEKVKEKKVLSVSYKGPGAIHSTINYEAQKRGFECLNLWAHCPYYLQGTTHFGLLSHLGSLLSECGGFNLETEELSVTWKELSKQIQGIIDKNPELQGMIKDLRKAQVRGPCNTQKKQNKIIKLEDFLKPKQ
ncbi:PAC2 family protein [Deltaproteobacteria bacterium]|nr:PAC2 family protein [Deltaproteobacteria bacterium]